MPPQSRLVVVTQERPANYFLTDGFKGNYAVQGVDDVNRAVRHVRDFGADLLLLDAADGAERATAALHLLREQWAHDVLPIIVLTETVPCDQLLQFLEAGASDFILKPMSPQTVDQRVQAQLANRDATARYLDAERRRVMSLALVRAAAATASAVSPLVDRLETLMRHREGDTNDEQLQSVLELTEQAVGVIDRLRQIATVDDVSYMARLHLLEEMMGLEC